MSRFIKFIKAFLLVVLVVLIGIGIWQRKNIKVVYTALTSDSETIAANMEQKREQAMEVLKDYEVTITPPSIEQMEQLLSGQISADELKEQLGLTANVLNKVQSNDSLNNQSNSSDDANKTQETQTSSQDEQSAQSTVTTQTANSLVNSCIAELYACEADLMGTLGGLKQAAINEWNSLPSSAKTKAKMRDIAMNGLSKCYDLEGSVDAQVKSILNRYENELSKIGADTSVIDTLWNQYCSEKESQKAYYINKYLG